jgi:PilZ domain
LDLSVVGCHVNAPTLFAAGTEVRVQIVHSGQMFTAFGVVIHGQPSSGMGIRFTEVALDQREILEKWFAAAMQRQS